MPRRAAAGVQALAIAGVVALFLFGIYSYNDLHGRLRKSEEKTERMKQQQDSVSAQLQVVYEHKSRLEKSLQQEKDDRLKMKQDLLEDRRQAEKKLAAEKNKGHGTHQPKQIAGYFEKNKGNKKNMKGVLNDQRFKDSQITALTADKKRLQSLYDDIQSDLTRVQDKQRSDDEEKVKMLEQNKLEYMQLKQERDNDVAQLKDQIANLQRRNTHLQEQIDDLNAQPAPQAGQRQAADEDDHANQRAGNVREEGDNGHVRRQGNDRQHKPIVDHNKQERKANLARPNVQADDTLMQIGKPDDANQKGYFVPKVAKPDDRNLKPLHLESDAHNNPVGGGGQDLQNNPQVLQVAPPKVNEHDVKESINIPVPKNLLNADDTAAKAHVLAAPANGDSFGGRGGAQGVGGLNAGAPAPQHLGGNDAQQFGAQRFDLNAGAAPHHGQGGHNQDVGGPNHPALQHGLENKVEHRMQQDAFPRGDFGKPRDSDAEVLRDSDAGNAGKQEQIAIPQVQHHNANDHKAGANDNHGDNVEEEEQRDEREYEEEKADAKLAPRNKRADVRGPNVGPVEVEER